VPFGTIGGSVSRTEVDICEFCPEALTDVVEEEVVEVVDVFGTEEVSETAAIIIAIIITIIPADAIMRFLFVIVSTITACFAVS
jgi:hypothetical protein